MHSLVSFETIKNISVNATANRQGAVLELSFKLSDPKQLVLWPEFVELERKNDLWKSTCFEAFWSLDGDAGYWELNVSPSGHWNLYYFENYRTPAYPNLKPENIDDIAIKVDSKSKVVNVSVPLQALRLETRSLNLSLNAVLKHNDVVSFWALKHSAGKPDFHKKENFILKI